MTIHFQLSDIAPYLPAIHRLPTNQALTKADLLISDFCIYQEADLAIYYVPFDYCKPDAKLFIAGITPGWTQMEMAYRTLIASMAAEPRSWGEIYGNIETSSSFAGSMRTNLISMLNELNLPGFLGLESSDRLFAEAHHLVNTTSVIRHAVFISDKNYTGSRPKILRHHRLREYVACTFSNELKQVPKALVIPQGKAVQAVLEYLIEQGELAPERCLLEFPHASGANGHRIKFFNAAKPKLKAQVERWFG